MNKDIDIYQDKAIREKENNKNEAINNLNNYKGIIAANDKENKELEHLDELVKGEGTTMYGEFISSYFAWTGLNRQKTRAMELNEMTKKDTVH